MADRSNYKPNDEITPLPVLTEAATILMKAITKQKDVFEFGSGGSTLWMSKFVKSLVSIEDDHDWYDALSEVLKETSDGRAQVRFARTKNLPNAIKGTGPWDVVFVDCLKQHSRRLSILLGAPYVKPGGWLIADDYNFPMTKAEVDKLRVAGWDVGIVGGVKMHPIRKVPVKTTTAFCKKPK